MRIYLHTRCAFQRTWLYESLADKAGRTRCDYVATRVIVALQLNANGKMSRFKIDTCARLLLENEY